MKRFLLIGVRMAILGILVFPSVPSAGHAMTPPEDPALVLETIEELFQFGYFDAAQRTSAGLLERNDLSEEQRLSAQVLLARSYLGLGKKDQARDNFCEVLRSDPQWRPNEFAFSQDEIEEFEEARASCDLEPNLVEDEVVVAKEIKFPTTSAPKRAKSAVLRSIIPGMGQHYKGQNTKGYIIQAAFVGALTFALISDASMNSAADEYNAARNEYLETDSQDEMDAIFATMEENYQEVDDKKKQRDAALIALGGIWVINLIDAGLGFPLEDSGVQIGHLITPSGQSAVAVQLRR